MEPAMPALHGGTRARMRSRNRSEHALALTAFLDLRFAETLPDGADKQERERHDVRGEMFRAPQRLAEDAIPIADAAPHS